MNIVVIMKHIFETEAKIQLDSNGDIDPTGVAKVINPYDEFAIEEAVKLKEAKGGKVTIVTYGGADCEESLRTALAMGADEATHIVDEDASKVDSNYVATVLAKAIEKLEPQLILGGQVAIDDGASQVASRIAEILSLPQINVVTKLEVKENEVEAVREIDGGTEVISAPMPVLVTAQRGLNEPRYPALKSIMKAKKKKIEQIAVNDLGVEREFLLKTLEFSLPKPRGGGEVVEGEPQELAQAIGKFLSNEAKVI
ncbi:electron transfer flavoprotein beta subunit [Desulfitispora alkaliphila]|uniref:electron transfer flavoprotein subunit beta/FixA family protein n=1 Tax=Desulfitispora alkaliphila TaxID=622674 RepID=UPI003D234DF6